MSKMKIIINSGGSIILSSFSSLLGGFDKPIIILLLIIFIDYLTGICKAIYNQKINSDISRQGLIKKVGYLLIVATSVLMDKIMGNQSLIRNFVIYFFIANEGLSIIENWGAMNLPLPSKLTKVFEKLKESGGNYESKS